MKTALIFVLGFVLMACTQVEEPAMDEEMMEGTMMMEEEPAAPAVEVEMMEEEAAAPAMEMEAEAGMMMEEEPAQ